MPAFKHIGLRLFAPNFDSTLTDLIISLDHLRKRKLGGTIRPWIFFQLKHIFHLMESIGSARIEGNHTTLAELVENQIDRPPIRLPGMIEIDNMESALNFIDVNADPIINRAYICELHKRVVKDLPVDAAGDPSPGVYRTHPVTITQSEHVPPETGHQVNDYMDELIHFINRPHPPKYDLLKTAIAHHRFMWIHPFANGNGRTGRLLTYAMLVKSGFAVQQGHILNPTAVFCINRERYYEHLALADAGTEEGVNQWSEYVLSGLKHEIEKIDRLLDHEYLSKEIIVPALRWSRERKLITDLESRILQKATEHPDQLIQAADVKIILPAKRNEIISRLISDLKKRKMLASNKPNERKYFIRFDNNYLLRGIIHRLGEEGFLAVRDNEQ